MCYTIDPSDVLRSARTVRRTHLGDLERAERVVNAYHRLMRWLLRDEIFVRYLREAFTRYNASVPFVDLLITNDYKLPHRFKDV